MTPLGPSTPGGVAPSPAPGDQNREKRFQDKPYERDDGEGLPDAPEALVERVPFRQTR